ncbi:MAG: hypothetical protein EBZ58_01870 [Bacteroidetes bacterium]|nr:hypothetical protein [Bacteroidota bacterium]
MISENKIETASVLAEKLSTTDWKSITKAVKINVKKTINMYLNKTPICNSCITFAFICNPKVYQLVLKRKGFSFTWWIIYFTSHKII